MFLIQCTPPLTSLKNNLENDSNIQAQAHIQINPENQLQLSLDTEMRKIAFTLMSTDRNRTELKRVRDEEKNFKGC